MKRMLGRLLTIVGIFGTLSAQNIPLVHGLVHIQHWGLERAPQHSHSEVAGPVVQAVTPESDHDALHTDCTMGWSRSRLIIASIAAVVSPLPADPWFAARTQSEPMVEPPSAHPPSPVISRAHARAPPLG